MKEKKKCFLCFFLQLADKLFRINTRTMRSNRTKQSMVVMFVCLFLSGLSIHFEILEFVAALVGSTHAQEITQLLLLQISLGQILQISIYIQTYKWNLKNNNIEQTTEPLYYIYYSYYPLEKGNSAATLILALSLETTTWDSKQTNKQQTNNKIKQEMNIKRRIEYIDIKLFIYQSISKSIYICM